MTAQGVHTLFPRSAFLGFDHLFDELDRVAKHANDNYPPHNIVKINDTSYLIELAVAGFARDELDIEVKDRSLTVSGKHENRGREYVHKGISAKKFLRSFRLSEYVQVNGADLIDGVLAINLEVVVPEEMRPRKIGISKSRGVTNDNTNNSVPETHFLTEESASTGK
jgi:molecular chaperone IbpA|tara:strand:- start:248 stop:748 length:501 start_codon:yes stop_codon:yes gene_type:complete